MKHLPKLFIETTVFNFCIEGKHGEKQKDALHIAIATVNNLDFVISYNQEARIMLFNTAKVMSKGQITLPIDIREKLKLQTGDRVALIYENDRVILMNPAIYAMENFTRAMSGEWEKAGIGS